MKRGSKPEYPLSFPEVLHNFTQSVLRDQPSDDDLLQYCADYFAKLVESHAQADFFHYFIQDILSGAFCIKSVRHHDCEDVYKIAECGDAGRFFILCDGHNGKQVAEFVAEEFFNKVFASEEWVKGDILKAFEVACDRIEDYMVREDGAKPPEGGREPDRQKRRTVKALERGSCAVFAVVRDGVLYVGNVGDSRCVRVVRNRKSGKVSGVAMNTDHKATNKDEQKRLEQDGIKVSGGRVLSILAVSRSFGDLIMKECRGKGVTCIPEVRAHKLSKPEDEDEDIALVLATDGLWDVMSNDEAADMAAQQLESSHGSCTAAARAIVEEAKKRESADDITALVVSLRRFSS